MTRVAFAALLVLAAGCGSAGSSGSSGADGSAAISHLEALAARQPDDPVIRYNLGTALLHARRFEEARPHLEAAGEAEMPSVRQPAFYNLGNSYLEPAFAGRAAGVDREAVLKAVGAYKEALLLAPTDQDAKWNLELARRLLDQQEQTPPPQGGGGGGSGGSGDDQARGRSDPNPQPADDGGPQPPLSPAEADRILSAAQQREVGLQREKLRKQQPRSTSAH